MKEQFKKILNSFLGEKVPPEEYVPEFRSKIRIGNALIAIGIIASIVLLFSETLKSYASLFVLIAIFGLFQSLIYYYHQTYGNYTIINASVQHVDEKLDWRKKRIRKKTVYVDACEDGTHQTVCFDISTRQKNFVTGTHILLYVSNRSAIYEKDGVYVICDRPLAVHIDTIGTDNVAQNSEERKK